MYEMIAAGGGSFWSYGALLLLAAVPWVDVFVVIPLGIAWGLNPAGTALSAFIGNWIPLLLLALFFREFSAWRVRRKARQAERRAAKAEAVLPQAEAAGAGEALPAEPPPGSGAGNANDGAAHGTSKKYARAKRIWEKYGVPGLALVAPVLLGTDLAALVALTFGSSRRWVMLWMTVSLLLWTVLLTVGSVYGLGYMGLFRPAAGPI
ncbi:hypothetical protein ACP26L_02420 [Paenibacillus sp. S-38]|uniref:small multi-drug export protein n=1 Tax=Paenibacillus sp. S-38 TaxID=3416710 RepID=UPI003CF40CA5